MAKKPREVAESVFGSNDYLKKVLALVPDEDRENVLSALGERVMAKDDYSRSMDDLTKKETAVLSYKETLDTWYGEKAQLLDEAEKLKAGKPAPVVEGGSAALKDLENYIKKDDLEKIVTARLKNSEETALNLFPRVMDLAVKHLHEYGKPLNPSEVIAHARKMETTLEAGYLDMTKDLREARAAKAEEDRRAKVREEIRAELQKENGHGVFPTGPNPGVESTLSGLGQDGNNRSSNRLKDAIEDHYKNGAARMSGS